jgi:hypothetical protein
MMHHEGARAKAQHEDEQLLRFLQKLRRALLDWSWRSAASAPRRDHGRLLRTSTRLRMNHRLNELWNFLRLAVHGEKLSLDRCCWRNGVRQRRGGHNCR